ncbi:hypothetical protein CMK22_20565 [Candidatus Poribacteria bacterium]|nr:hypothetical protein [Candidatus Poribacteria bacterium]
MPSQKSILKALVLSIGIHLIIILLFSKLIQTRKLLVIGEKPELLVSLHFLPKELRITPRKRVKVRSFILTDPRKSIKPEIQLLTEREASIRKPEIFSFAESTQTSLFRASLSTNNVSGTDGLGIKLGAAPPPILRHDRPAGDLQKGFRPTFQSRNTFVTKKLLPDNQRNDLFTIDTSLVKIARNIVSSSKDIVDIVFLIDGSRSMRNDIESVRNHLQSMVDVLNLENMDFTIGVVIFRHHRGYGLLGWDFEVTRQTKSIGQVKKVLKKVKCIGGEKAIDSIYRATEEVKFRVGAERRFILVTDEYLAGSYKPEIVLDRLKSKKISLSIIGRKEQTQKKLAHQTFGIWLPIDSLRL